MIRLTRQRKEEDEDISAFWLITYSDMVTLLLSFFLLMYSFSVLSDDSKQELVDELNTVSANMIRREKPREDLELAAREIASQFRKDQAFVENTETEVTVGLSSEVTFASGDDALSDEARDALVKAAAILALLIASGLDPRRLEVVGFGDTRARGPNETPEGRAQNRRIEIKILKKAREKAG